MIRLRRQEGRASAAEFGRVADRDDVLLFSRCDSPSRNSVFGGMAELVGCTSRAVRRRRWPYARSTPFAEAASSARSRLHVVIAPRFRRFARRPADLDEALAEELAVFLQSPDLRVENDVRYAVSERRAVGAVEDHSHFAG